MTASTTTGPQAQGRPSESNGVGVSRFVEGHVLPPSRLWWHREVHHQLGTSGGPGTSEFDHRMEHESCPTLWIPSLSNPESDTPATGSSLPRPNSASDSDRPLVVGSLPPSGTLLEATRTSLSTLARISFEWGCHHTPEEEENTNAPRPLLLGSSSCRDVLPVVRLTPSQHGRQGGLRYLHLGRLFIRGHPVSNMQGIGGRSSGGRAGARRTPSDW